MNVIVLRFLFVLAAGLALLAPVASAQTNINWPTNQQPNVVSLVPMNMVVSESGSNGVITPGSVIVRRDGSTNFALTVYLQIEGTAQNGVDYRYLSNHVRIPAGLRQTIVQVFPQPDTLVEETETVRLTILPTLCIAIAPPPPECYQVGSNHTAIISIRDGSTIGTNRHPTVVITSPTNGASFVRPADVFILAQASDPDGTVSFVEFYAGTNRIGIRTNLPVMNIMGPFHMVWSNAPAGEHRLTARAVDNLGAATISSAVVIHVQGFEPPHLTVKPRLLPDISAAYSSFSIHSNGQVQAWGKNHEGNLGIGNTSNGLTPRLISASSSVPHFWQIAGGTYSTVGLNREGRLMAWGKTSAGAGGDGPLVPTALPTPSGAGSFVQVSAGNAHALALTASGEIYIWGANGVGQLGMPQPSQADEPMLFPKPVGVRYWVKAIAADIASFAISDAGHLYAWGYNRYGELGIGRENTNNPSGEFSPVRIQNPPGVTGWSDIASGGLHSLALSREGKLYSFGRNSEGQLGFGASTVFPFTVTSPQPVPFPTNVHRWVGIAAGQLHSLALAENGELYAWGYNEDGRLGTGPGSESSMPALVQRPPGVAGWREVAAGSWHTLAIDQNCQVYSWGHNEQGQLGVGHTNNLTLPTLVSGATPVCHRVEEPAPTFVNLRIEDAVASEPGILTVVDHATVMVTRSGPTNHNLQVYFHIGGTAFNGVDYQSISNTVTIPAGMVSVPLRVIARADNLVEGTETVVFELAAPVCAAIAPPPPGCYQVGTSRVARVEIRDGPALEPTNHPPIVHWIRPASGTTVYSPTSVWLEVEAGDVDGFVREVIFTSGSNIVGRAVGTNAHYRLLWTNPPVGIHLLRARAVDNQGASTSTGEIRLTVLEATLPNRAPIVHWIEPTNSARFSAGSAIRLSVAAEDPDGYPTRAQFFANQNLVADQTVFYVTPPSNGSRHVFHGIWSNAPAGTYQLTSRAQDNQGKWGTSAPITVFVSQPVSNHFATRDLPPFYVAGRKLMVVIQVRPPHSNLVYTIEDTAPPNWVIGAVNQGGVYDPATRKVKFGPFFEGLPRELTYEVTPPAGESGLREFHGTLAVNGVLSPIGGDRVISSLSGHPADRTPLDFRITSAELTAYGHAWQTGEGSNSIPISFVSRAAMIWRRGETYFIDPAHQPPLCWVPSNQVTSATIGLANTDPDGVPTALASMPTNCQPGVAFNVRIAVEPGVRHSAYAAEDRPAFGWRPSGISHGGVFDPASGKIKWGPFADNQPRSLEYQVVPGLDFQGSAGFAGTVSFDGINHPITGLRHISFGTIPPRETWVLHRESGEVSLRLGGQSGLRYTIEVSTNLLDWTRLNSVICSNETVRVTDPEGAGKPNRFYRAVPEP